jgi:hypothetical protein
MYRTTYNIRAVGTHNEAIEAATALVGPLGLDKAEAAVWEYKTSSHVLILQTLSRCRPDPDTLLQGSAPAIGYTSEYSASLLQAVVEDLRNDREVSLSAHCNLRQFEFPSTTLRKD